ncbi:hypothetical protein [Mycobacterium sp. E3198]|uniref:hypothetical protein n=1 Tax=Mycobacterium sp. E3198 TaxID=1834143 RepID=UPI0008008555|nr:hypothetical protein [Mycobacterium sp. E3198]OBG35181.1 hypothetical protein A5673_20740 [Mycobacterium sp. E3198]
MIGGPTEARFWSVAEPLLADAAVTRSTMMGLPCLRADGRFFASFDRRNTALLVKLPAARVDELVESGAAEPFAPSGRRFREWASIGSGRPDAWPALLREAFAFVAGQGSSGD